MIRNRKGMQMDNNVITDEKAYKNLNYSSSSGIGNEGKICDIYFGTPGSLSMWHRSYKIPILIKVAFWWGNHTGTKHFITIHKMYYLMLKY